ncbi:MAG TPA: hypothetical protein VMZ53_13595 [Kofleriaceae bacterium]|nr:hypothetical protein [Kofleriaceae bacterium]
MIVGLIDDVIGSRFTLSLFVSVAYLAACGGTPRETAKPVVAKPHTAAPHHLDDPDLNPPPPKKLLSIEWKSVTLTSEADALALWKTIAPTGDDYTEKLDEIPDDGPIATQLALALLHGGNFSCSPTPSQCGAPVDVPEPMPTATFDDPCLRRILAMWSLQQLDDDDVQWVRDSLKTIVAIPPPESQLVMAALDVVPTSEQDLKLELLSIAQSAGHRELANGLVGSLDEAHLVDAAQKHHMSGPLDMLSAEAHRAVFIAAINDAKLTTNARLQAITEIVTSEDKLSKETRATLATATRSPDCTVAAAAARALVQHGEKKFAPARPANRSSAAMMRAMCVLASYEQLQGNDEASYLLGYVPAKGLEVVTVTYDQYSDADDDGDGDPHTQRTTNIVPRTEVVLPELEDLVRAMAHCTGTVCRSDDREFRFTFKGDQLRRVEVVERPPCVPR